MPKSSGEVIDSEATRRVAAELGCEVAPLGARISVYWPGSDEWYESVVTGHHVVRDDAGAVLQLKHLCDYRNESGACSHDLQLCEYEVVELPAPAPTHDYDLRPRDGSHDVARLDLDAEVLEAAQLEHVALSTRVRENVARAAESSADRVRRGRTWQTRRNGACSSL